MNPLLGVVMGSPEFEVDSPEMALEGQYEIPDGWYCRLVTSDGN